MERQGIAYDIKMGLGENQWVWTIHTPNPRSGRVTGSRRRAIAAAQKAIDVWCYKHPAFCAPRPSPRASAIAS